MRDDAISVIVCGASAAALFPAYAIQLRYRLSSPLRVLTTHSAERFLRPETIALFADEAWGSDRTDLVPTELARRSRAIVVLPASANMLAAAALGLAASPAQTALLAATRPALFFPAMNRVMWERRSTQRHVRTLRADGHTVIDPIEAEVYENWQRQVVKGPSLPPPVDTAEIIASWLTQE